MSDLLTDARRRLAMAVRARELAERNERVNSWSSRHRQAAETARQREYITRREVLRLEGQRNLPL